MRHEYLVEIGIKTRSQYDAPKQLKSDSFENYILLAYLQNCGLIYHGLNHQNTNTGKQEY